MCAIKNEKFRGKICSSKKKAHIKCIQVYSANSDTIVSYNNRIQLERQKKSFFFFGHQKCKSHARRIGKLLNI